MYLDKLRFTVGITDECFAILRALDLSGKEPLQLKWLAHLAELCPLYDRNDRWEICEGLSTKGLALAQKTGEKKYEAIFNMMLAQSMVI